MQYSSLPIRYDTRCYFNVRSKADLSQLNQVSLIYRTEPTTKKWGKAELKSKHENARKYR